MVGPLALNEATNLRTENATRLTYWIANHLNDADCYSIRAKTRKEVKALLEEVREVLAWCAIVSERARHLLNKLNGKG